MHQYYEAEKLDISENTVQKGTHRDDRRSQGPSRQEGGRIRPAATLTSSPESNSANSARGIIQS